MRTIKCEKSYFNSKENSLKDIMYNLEISANSLIEMLDNYLSNEDIVNFDEYCRKELDIITENVDLSPDNLLSKVSDTDLKNMVKSAGVQLKGNESKEELTGMAKALANKSESKLKRKKGIGLTSKFLEN